MVSLASHHTLPPFPNEVPIAPLVSVALRDLEPPKEKTASVLFEAFKKDGFCYLDCLGCPLGEQMVALAEELNGLQQEFFRLPSSEKDPYRRKDEDVFHGYGYYEAQADNGRVGLRNEFLNVRKDNLCLREDEPLLPPLFRQHRDSLLNFIKLSHKLVNIVLESLSDDLGLASGTLSGIHRFTEFSGDHVRFLQAPHQPMDEDAKPPRGQHTDYGSLTILFNWLGGLQIRDRTTSEWLYVKPVPGSCVINLGDAMVKFTAGILRSNIHRVVSPPGLQSGCTRTSLGYFSRPEDNVSLRPLRSSSIIAAGTGKEDVAEEYTNAEWTRRKAAGLVNAIFDVTRDQT